MKIVTFALMPAVFLSLSSSVTAVDALTDASLSKLAGKNSIVIIPKNKKASRFLVQEDLAKRETPAYHTVSDIQQTHINKVNKLSSEQNDNMTQNFGSESYSYRWSGNYQDIFKVDGYPEFIFNYNTGRIEANRYNSTVRIHVE